MYLYEYPIGNERRERGECTLTYPALLVTRIWPTPFSLNSWMTSEHGVVDGTVMAAGTSRLPML